MPYYAVCIYIALEPKANQFAFFKGKLRKASEINQEVLSKAIEKFEGLRPLPVFSADSEQEFVNAMMENKLSSELMSLATDIEDTLRIAETFCKDLGLDEPDQKKFLPGQDKAIDCVKEMLALASLATCLKILRSKAALCKAPSLAGNVEATLNFIQENSIELPDAIRKRMLELQSNLSAPPPKKAKTASS